MRKSLKMYTKRGTIVLIAAVVAVANLLSATPFATPAIAAETVMNGDLEQVTADVPNCFTQAGWGNNTTTWAITDDAHSGTKAQSVKVSNYTSGDAKLLMKEDNACAPDVEANAKYTVSLWYKSTSAKNNLTMFRHSDAGWTYWADLKTLPAAAGWTEVTATTPAVPAGTDMVSFGVSLAGNGTLITDDYAMTEVTAPAPLPDGELTHNGGLEEGGNPPARWFQAGWGDGQVTGGVTNDAHAGNKAYSITMAGRTEGDFKLLPEDEAAPVVQPGKNYDLSVWYKSTSAVNSVTVFAHTAAGWGYWTELRTLPAAANWTQAKLKTPRVPAGVDAISWGVSLAADGTLVTDDYSTRESAPEAVPAGEPATNGKWTVKDYELPVRAIHSTLLKNGKILLIAGSGNDAQAFKSGTFKASIWDPVSGVFNTLNVPKDMFCAGHVTLADGRVLIQGGTKSYPTPGTADYGGLKDSWIFNPDTNEFTPSGDANEGHWYPTLTALGNGDVWMAGGLKEDATGAVNTEMFSNATKKWLPGNQVKQTYNFWGLYPHMFLMKDGRLFYSGAHTFGNALPGTGSSIYNIQTGAIADVPGLRMKDMRDQAASILLPPAQDQKVLITGGGNILGTDPAINLTDIINLNDAKPQYKPGPNLPGLGKMYVNATILPDRTVLLANGGRLNRDEESNVKTAAIYDPATNTMREVAADPIGRNYHSSSVLLPDGRVVTVGSNPGTGDFEMRISVYEPSYMFKGKRPELRNVPATAAYGANVMFGAAMNGKAIKSAQLTRPMSVTHQTDSNVRLVDVPITMWGTTAIAQIPNNKNLLPPGPYMLTVTDANGVPSLASWIMIK